MISYIDILSQCYRSLISYFQKSILPSSVILFLFAFRPLWEDLKHCKTPLLLVTEEKDTKFKTIAQEMFDEVCHGLKSGDNLWNEIHEIVEIPNSGHAAHLENPLPLISALRQFLSRLGKREFVSNPKRRIESWNRLIARSNVTADDTADKSSEGTHVKLVAYTV